MGPMPDETPTRVLAVWGAVLSTVLGLIKMAAKPLRLFPREVRKKTVDVC